MSLTPLSEFVTSTFVLHPTKAHHGFVAGSTHEKLHLSRTSVAFKETIMTGGMRKRLLFEPLASNTHDMVDYKLRKPK
eukprot:scaffold34595_cov160-Amphora_coffeaeformis.AAC.6